jgi:hypothetical protein
MIGEPDPVQQVYCEPHTYPNRSRAVVMSIFSLVVGLGCHECNSKIYRRYV